MFSNCCRGFEFFLLAMIAGGVIKLRHGDTIVYGIFSFEDRKRYVELRSLKDAFCVCLNYISSGRSVIFHLKILCLDSCSEVMGRLKMITKPNCYFHNF